MRENEKNRMCPESSLPTIKSFTLRRNQIWEQFICCSILPKAVYKKNKVSNLIQLKTTINKTEINDKLKARLKCMPSFYIPCLNKNIFFASGRKNTEAGSSKVHPKRSIAVEQVSCGTPSFKKLVAAILAIPGRHEGKLSQVG